MVAPRTEDESTTLLVKGVVGYVYLADGLEHPSRLPVDFSIEAYDGPELSVVAVNAISPGMCIINILLVFIL